MTKVVFFGTSKFVIPIIDRLRKKFDLSLVVTTEKQLNSPVISYCNTHKVCCYVATDFGNKKELQKLQQINADIGIVASFGGLIPKPILNLFPKGILNIHPSLLPKYRGPTPVQTVLLANDKRTGVSLIILDEELDHGPIIAQKKEEILPNDTSVTLYERLFKIGAQLIEETLQKYLDGKIELKEQVDRNATYTKKLIRDDGYIDFNPQSPQYPKSPKYLDRMIRAYYPWPGVWSKLEIRSSKSEIVKFLPLGMMQLEGKKPVAITTFARGYPQTRELLEKLFGKSL